MTERTKKQGISNERELTGAGIAIRSAAQHYSCFIIMIHSLSIGNESGTQAVGNNIIIFFKYVRTSNEPVLCFWGAGRLRPKTQYVMKNITPP